MPVRQNQVQPNVQVGCISIPLGCKLQIHLRDLKALFPLIFNAKGLPASSEQHLKNQVMDYRSSEDNVLEICGNLGGAGNCWI